MTADLTTRQSEIEYESVALGKSNYEKARLRSESQTQPGRHEMDDSLGRLQTVIERFIESALGVGIIAELRTTHNRRGATKEARAALKAMTPEARKEHRRAQKREFHRRSRAQPIAAELRAGRGFSVAPYLLHILPEQAAYLTIRYALDGAAGNRKISSAALALGTAIEDHIELVNLDEEAPGLYRKVMEQVKRATSERHRAGVLRHVISEYKIEQLEWTDTAKVHIGKTLIELYDETEKMVAARRDTVGRNDTPIRLMFTEKALTVLESGHAKCATWCPVHLPMIVPPRNWHIEDYLDKKTGEPKRRISGGYLTRAIPPRKAGMIQQRIQGAMQAIIGGNIEPVFNAVNSIQSTAWRINQQLLVVMHEARSGGERFESLFVECNRPLPARPPGIDKETPVADLTIDQRETLTSWKRSAALVHDFNARQESKRVGVMQKLFVADKFVEEEAIYFPHYLDFRGRIYPYASYLNPQSSDVGRALLEFAIGKPIGERGLFWLKVHVANLFGVDKVSFEERVKWVNDNMEKLNECATDPLDGSMFWTTADSPWCALAACFELAGALVAGAAYVSHIPIAMDGSCSGLQHYSAMLRDPIGGAAVNLVPAEKPGDIYTQVANRAQVLSDISTDANSPHWKGRVVRGVAKQPTMTMCYSSTIFGMQKQIAKAVEDLGGSKYLGGGDVNPASAFMARIVWGAIGDVVVAAREAMAFLQECSRISVESGRPLYWTAPSGFLVVMGYVKSRPTRIDLHYKGTRVNVRWAVDTETLDPKQQSNGIAPNFVHSLDSAHLMATVNLGVDNGLNHWACIHDSFGTHAADVDVLHACIREAFIEQYTPNVLENFRAELIGQLPPELHEKVPPVPAQGTLDLAAVRESKYLFA